MPTNLGWIRMGIAPGERRFDSSLDAVALIGRRSATTAKSYHRAAGGMRHLRTHRRVRCYAPPPHASVGCGPYQMRRVPLLACRIRSDFGPRSNISRAGAPPRPGGPAEPSTGGRRSRLDLGGGRRHRQPGHCVVGIAALWGGRAGGGAPPPSQTTAHGVRPSARRI